jgi:hypothetical protein
LDKKELGIMAIILTGNTCGAASQSDFDAKKIYDALYPPIQNNLPENAYMNPGVASGELTYPMQLAGNPPQNPTVGQSPIANAPKRRKEKRGRSRYSLEEKMYYVKKWDDLDPEKNTQTLVEFLECEFGTTGGILYVAPSTFYDWRKQLIKRGLYNP